MTTANPNLVSAVLAESEARTWPVAVLEWDIIGLDHDPRNEGVCVCGQEGLTDLYTIHNRRTGSQLDPIGSTCINQFGREDLDRAVKTLPYLLRLRDADAAGESIELTSRYFSRASLEELHDAGALPPTKWNGGYPSRDLTFLVQMFNKRDKDSISDKQRSKIRALLDQAVLPFIRSDTRLRH